MLMDSFIYLIYSSSESAYGIFSGAAFAKIMIIMCQVGLLLGTEYQLELLLDTTR